MLVLHFGFSRRVLEKRELITRRNSYYQSIDLNVTPVSDGRTRQYLTGKTNRFLGVILAFKVRSMKEGYFSP